MKGENFEETILIFSKDELYFCERRLGFHENRNNNKTTKKVVLDIKNDTQINSQ